MMYEAARTDDTLDDDEELAGLTENPFSHQKSSFSISSKPSQKKLRRDPNKDDRILRSIAAFIDERRGLSVTVLCLLLFAVFLVSGGVVEIHGHLGHSDVGETHGNKQQPAHIPAPSPALPVVEHTEPPVPVHHTNLDDHDHAHDEATPTIPAKDDNNSDSDNGADAHVPAPEPEPAPEPKPEPTSEVKDYGDWGHWKFYDGAEETRPKNDYIKEADPVYGDIHAEDFPEDAWQADAVYVNHFLDEAFKLVNRTKEAIYAEYGAGAPLTPEQVERRKKMFHTAIIDCDKEVSLDKKVITGHGGWVCEKSFDGLVRRLLHAMMTNDSFSVVLGGHSAAAGHGNHLAQSYTLQISHVLEPVFEKLGVKFHARNMAHGGLGTLESGLGSGDIYGREVDMIIWDSSMTENSVPAHDLFNRQALIGGNRSPMIYSFFANTQYLIGLAKNFGVDIGGMINPNFEGFPETESEEQAKTMPDALAYLHCSKENQSLCNQHKYRTQCWVERDDVTPPTKQLPAVDGRASWHPGFRTHRIIGRGITMLILSALENALTQWSEVTIYQGHPLPDENWHVTNYYEDIRTKVNAAASSSPCAEWFDWMPRLCSTPLKARTEFSPRTDPENTSIRSILKPAPDGSVSKLSTKLLYEGEDVPNPALQVPEGEIDVRAIADYRRRDRDLTNYEYSEEESSTLSRDSARRNLGGEEIVPSSLWYTIAKPGFCDGSSSSFNCQRTASSDCLLAGHNDDRAGIRGDGYSGWIVMNLKDVKEGIIVVKLHTWFHVKVGAHLVNPNTEGMDSRRHLKLPLSKSLSNYASKNENNTVNLEEFSYADPFEIARRNLKVDADAVMTETLEFDFAVNGKITTWNKSDVLSNRHKQERVVELFKILDDPSVTGDVELALRLRGVGREQNFDLTHVYWA
eukprot:CAMPEP_0196824974 /NCGR_PEP_ID=MMETSP1362-20130617/92791_1 /TAXON_ID=163516 /ORGANISM="Leptocylindrus danicus, Strain CCMP1856" /LENGTH=911 /DNA_ID=CAMNT_0042205337 /DNA_START=109 /DNA_END=2844 /DNA_ORIENTATION=+